MSENETTREIKAIREAIAALTARVEAAADTENMALGEALDNAGLALSDASAKLAQALRLA